MRSQNIQDLKVTHVATVTSHHLQTKGRFLCRQISEIMVTFMGHLQIIKRLPSIVAYKTLWDEERRLHSRVSSSNPRKTDPERNNLTNKYIPRYIGQETFEPA